MTKSTITREQLLEIIETDHVQCGEASQLARMALAAMDSEPVAWTWHYREQWHVTNDERRAEFVAKDGDVAVLPLYRHAQPALTSESITVTDDMAYAFHHALTDSMIGADDVEEIKTGLRAVFANLTAPVVSAEYPDRLPCSVLLEPGLRFGKGIKTSTMLAALARRAVHESDMAALSPEEIAEFQERIEDFKALIAQPAPVVPEEITIETATIIAYGLPTTNIGKIFKAGHDTCRAAMLQAQSDDDGEPTDDERIMAIEGIHNCERCGDEGWIVGEMGITRCACGQAGNSPVIGIDLASGPERTVEVRYVAPPGYVMVPKEPTEVMLTASYMFAHVEATRESWAAMLAAAPQPQNAPQSIPEIIPDCWCRTCRPVVLNDMRFVVCPDCGNKRCPRANDHRNACTGSNEPGQEGSAYPDAQQEVKGE